MNEGAVETLFKYLRDELKKIQAQLTRIERKVETVKRTTRRL